MQTVENLDVFKLAHQLTLKIYQLTAQFPTHERFGLTSQIRRSAASVGANLAEGGARLNRNEYKQFAGIARASAAEVRYHLLLAKDLKYISQSEYEELVQDYDRVGKMLGSLVRSLSHESPVTNHDS